MTDLNKPKIIALADAKRFVNTNDKIWFYCDNNDCKFVEISYKVPQFKKDIKHKNHSSMDKFKKKSKKVRKSMNDKIKQIMIKLNCYKNNDVYHIKWKDYYIVYNGEGAITVINNDGIVCELKEDTNYQSGDCCVRIYDDLGNGDLMIFNCGDVTSALIFTLNNPNVYVYEDFKDDITNIPTINNSSDDSSENLTINDKWEDLTEKIQHSDFKVEMIETVAELFNRKKIDDDVVISILEKF